MLCSKSSYILIQNPLSDPPTREKYLNRKICPLLAWIDFIFPTTWLLGIKVAINEMTMSFVHVVLGKEDVLYHPVYNTKRRRIGSEAGNVRS